MRCNNPYILPGLLMPEVDNVTKVRIIKRMVCTLLEVDVELLSAKVRKHEIVMARQYCIYLLSITSTMSLKSIATHFGNRDHSTIIYSRDKMQDLIDIYPEHAKNIKQILCQLAEYNIYKLQFNNYGIKQTNSVTGSGVQ